MPLLFLITPAKVVVPPVTVNVDVVATYEFRITSPTALPVNEANDCELPYKSKVAFVPPIDKADEEDKDPPLPNFNVPALIVVVPVYRFPLVSVNVPVPTLVREITPAPPPIVPAKVVL